MVAHTLKVYFLAVVCCQFFVIPVLGNSNDVQDSCSFVVNLSPSTGITLIQHLSSKESLAISLSYEGNAWLGVGFNQDGNMIGSTVVIGFPDKPLEADVNPGRYYLGAKQENKISRVDASGTRLGVEWTTTEASKAVTSYDDEDEEGGEEWRRSLYFPQEHHRLLAIYDASIEQNLTHTTLSFTRPIKSSDKYMTAVSPNQLNTLIWAVGISNTFGYHGAQKGSHTLNFTECAHGALDSTMIPSNEKNEDEALSYEEEEYEALSYEEVQTQSAHTSAEADTSTPFSGLWTSAYFSRTMNVCLFLVLSLVPYL